MPQVTNVKDKYLSFGPEAIRFDSLLFENLMPPNGLVYAVVIKAFAGNERHTHCVCLEWASLLVKNRRQ